MCSELWLLSCTDTNTPCPLQHQCNWCQLPLPAARRTSRANVGAPDLSPATIDAPTPPSSRPVQSLQPIMPVRPVLTIQFLPYSQDPWRPNFSNRFDYLAATTQDRKKNHESPPDPESTTISPFVPPLYRLRPSQPAFIRDTPGKVLPYQPLLLLMPPDMILHPPQTPLPTDNFPLPLLLHILLPSLSCPDIAPLPRPIFGLSTRNPHRAIIWGNL